MSAFLRRTDYQLCINSETRSDWSNLMAGTVVSINVHYYYETVYKRKMIFVGLKVISEHSLDMLTPCHISAFFTKLY